MSFVDPVYLLFLGGLVTLNLALSSSRKAQNVVLLVASLVFYGWIQPWLVALVLFCALHNFGVSLRIAAAQERGESANGWLGLSLLLNLGVLAGFKYFGWFAIPVEAALNAVGFQAHPTTLQVALPVGLSFYTFHAMAYTVDVWRKQFEVRRDLIDFVLFVGFFPMLCAGPVERAGNLLAQVEHPRSITAEKLASGFGLAMFGAFKKVVIADTMSPRVNVIFDLPDPSWAMIWSAALGFSIQVLADFSGYTDMARGSARMLGFELMENFRHPYMSQSPMDFWTRWHISFSTWLRDYVYMPACFSPWIRRWVTLPGVGELSPFGNTTRALFITMLCSGIWHGSTYNYVVWGLYYAVIGTVWAWIATKIPRKTKKSRDWRPILIPVMFAHTLVGMMIFREPDLTRAIGHLFRNPFGGTADQWVIASGMVMMCLYGAVPLICAMLWEEHVAPKLKDSAWLLPVRTTAWTASALLLVVFYRSTVNDFVYFQF
jgi:alginate O-acetyltransferase complex protein AlgI